METEETFLDDKPVHDWNVEPARSWRQPHVTRLAPATVAKCGVAGLVCFAVVFVVIVIAFLAL